MKQGKIALPGQMWEYEAVEERVTRPDIGEYVTCALRVRTAEGAITLHDVSVDRRFVEQLAGLLNDGQLEPVHLREVVEDFLACPEELAKALAGQGTALSPRARAQQG